MMHPWVLWSRQVHCWPTHEPCQPGGDQLPIFGANAPSPRRGNSRHKSANRRAGSRKPGAVGYTGPMQNAHATNKLARTRTSEQFRYVMRHWWSIERTDRNTSWMYLLATAIYNCVFAVILTFMFLAFNHQATLWNTFLETLLISNCIGFSIHLLLELLHRIGTPRGFNTVAPLIRNTTVIVTMLAGVFGGYLISFAILGKNFAALLSRYPRAALSLLMIASLGCTIWFLIMDGQSKRLRAETDEARNSESQQRLTALARDAELRALQAQIEPHFLFNTLANVQALIDYEPQKAKLMLDAFIQHLRMSLAVSRQSHATLATELDFVKTYLQLLEIRMGARLRYRIDCAPDLHDTPLAPLLLQPLVENAVKYGLEPKIEGGEIVIRAARDGNEVVLSVVDDGVGIGQVSTAKSGAGTGMKNVRDRLASLYGNRATLSVDALGERDHGTIATIRIKDQ
jgi:signal transduction histidine kinase